MKLISSLTLLGYASSFSLPSDGFIKVPSWKQVSEPPATGGRRYGPNWSLDPKTLDPKQTDDLGGAAMVWPIEREGKYVHPEMRNDLPVGEWLKSRPNLGICMSGGGQRAATTALGWYRALNHLGLLTQARYLGANSGATWTTMPLFAKQMLDKKDKNQNMDYEEYVGKYSGTDVKIGDKSEIGKIGEALTKSNILAWKDDDPETAPTFNSWCKAIQENYVTPIMGGTSWENDFWLDLSNAYLWNTEATKNILDDHSFPFPIFVASGFFSSNDAEYFPIENTPLYSGLPIDPRLAQGDLVCSTGGGFIQGVALNSESLKNTDPVPVDSDNLYMKEFKNPSKVVKIAELTGASSNFGAAADAQVTPDLEGGLLRPVVDLFAKLYFKNADLTGYLEPGKYKWWSPSTGGDPVDLNLVDGGMFDNLGVLALLRRGASTIIVCNSCDFDVIKTEDKDIFTKAYDVAGLFGLAEPITPPKFTKAKYRDTLNARSKVFEEEEFFSLLKDMRELRAHGKPLVRRKTLQLQPNHFAGIYESRQVEMIFCFNQAVDGFDCGKKFPWNILPSWIPGGPEDFPYIDTLTCDYSEEDVHKLSGISAYSLVEGLKNVNFDISQVEK